MVKQVPWLERKEPLDSQRIRGGPLGTTGVEGVEMIGARLFAFPLPTLLLMLVLRLSGFALRLLALPLFALRLFALALRVALLLLALLLLLAFLLLAFLLRFGLFSF